MRLHLDFETFSTVDIYKVTTSYYVSHPDTEILMLGWAVDDGPVNLWEPHKGDMPRELFDALCSANTLHAFNVPFERGLLFHKLGFSTLIFRWRDTQVEALAMSFPASLDDVLEAIGLEKKDPRGEQLIHRFSKPAPASHKADRYNWTNRPEEWEAFCEYCKKDVEVERRLHLWLDQYHPMSDEEWQLWFLDQEINERGIPVDMEMAEGALHIWDRVLIEIKEELKQITGLDKITRGPFLEWLEVEGFPIPNTQAATIQDALKHCNEPHITRALQLWGYKEVRALDKFKAILRTHQNGRVHGVFQFAGASRTRRWAGRQLQPHNLKRTIIDPDQIDTLAEVIKRMDLPTMKLFW